MPVINLKAQNIEVTSSDVYIRSKSTLGYLRFTENGALILDKSGANHNSGLIINVNHDDVKALTILNDWANPAAFTVYGDGTAFLKSTAVTSDSTLKKNIATLEPQTEKIKKLRGVSFQWKNKGLKDDKLTYGLIAQELEKVYPDMVFTNDSGIRAIYYDELIPVLIEGFNEQQLIIEELKSDVAELKNQAGNLKGASFSEQESIDNERSELFQNTPNPFTQSTQIRYFVADNVTDAAIYIYDMNGTQLKKYEIHQKGEGDIKIYGNELKAGMYMYSMVIDGKLTDTKKMVLTD